MYHYSRLGVVLGLLHIPFYRKNHYYCSQFVAEILKSADIADLNKDCSLYFSGDFAKNS